MAMIGSMVCLDPTPNDNIGISRHSLVAKIHLQRYQQGKIEPNWKVKPLLDWMNYLNPTIWKLGPNFSIDEMTMGFQGMHQDKRRITYKNEGDGFQCNALCQDGFTYQFYMRNHPAPKEYLREGLSPLHS